MIARFLGAAFSWMSLAGGVARAVDLAADWPVLGALAEIGASATSPEKGSPKDFAGQGDGTAAAKRSPGTDDQTRRVRELIYFFRTYRVFCRDEEWARTIRELATIGKAAVPELVAELDRTDRDATLRSLAFCLRAIGDARAVPALVRAIPKALRPPGSDCGVGISDPDLRRFMLAHQNYKNDKTDKETYVACGRPVNEIISAIERILKHREPPDVGDQDPLRHVFLGGTAQEQAQQRGMFVQRQKLWQAWWSEHWKEFVTKEELQSVELPRRDKDLVEIAGIARFGALFPTGAEVRLGPVRMLRLTTAAYRNGKSHLDLDTGRVFQEYEGMKAADWGEPTELGARISTWYRRNGIDVRCGHPIDGADLLLWLVDDSRWDTIDAEVQKDEPMPLGREATDSLVRFDQNRMDFKYDELATFLFTTREGARGIIQVFPKDKDTDRFRVRYRTWLTGAGKPNTVRAPVAEAADRAHTGKTRGAAFAKTITTTLELPAEGRKCLLDLKNARTVSPPEFMTSDEIANGLAFRRNERFARWCRDQGIDILSSVSRREAVGGAAKDKAAAPEPSFVLIGLEMIEARILPQSFEELTVEEVREILDRSPANRSRTVRFTIDAHLAERPDTFAFKTRGGAVGLLQFEAPEQPIEAPEQQSGKLTIRYRIEQRD
jgi:hypothetical protein